MELCPDGDLRKYLNSKNKKLPEEEAINIIRQLMKGFKEITDKVKKKKLKYTLLKVFPFYIGIYA